MKQSIDSKQLKELSFRQVKKLGEMSGLVSYPRTEEEWEERQTREHLTMYISLMQWINIGRMIEILGIRLVSCVQHINPVWVVHFNAKEYIAVELCDALWEAVKEIL